MIGECRSSQSQGCRKTERNRKPGDTTQNVRPDSCRRLGSNGSLPVRLIEKDCSGPRAKLDYTKDETEVRLQRDVGTFVIAFDGP
jgi:hypothetical protein